MLKNSSKTTFFFTFFYGFLVDVQAWICCCTGWCVQEPERRRGGVEHDVEESGGGIWQDYFMVTGPSYWLLPTGESGDGD